MTTFLFNLSQVVEPGEKAHNVSAGEACREFVAGTRGCLRRTYTNVELARLVGHYCRDDGIAPLRPFSHEHPQESPSAVLACSNDARIPLSSNSAHVHSLCFPVGSLRWVDESKRLGWRVVQAFWSRRRRAHKDRQALRDRERRLGRNDARRHR